MNPSRLLRLALWSAIGFCILSSARLPAQTSVWTWHNNNGRTGQNASETSLTPSTVTKTGFGQLCHYAVDGQVYAQPLVLTNATVLGTHHSSVVYIVTQNDSVYLLDGTNCGFIATQFSVPTVANGYVYVGAQSDNSTGSSTKGQGTFYIFGIIPPRSC